MPLEKGSSQEVISRNISELTDANKSRKKPRSHDQIVAIALYQAGKSRKKKGTLSESLMDFILDLVNDSNKSLVEGVIMEGFNAIFEEEIALNIPQTPKGINEYQKALEDHERTAMAAARAAQEMEQSKEQLAKKVDEIEKTETAQRATQGRGTASDVRSAELASARGTTPATNTATNPA